jgi:hypothetical protein
MKENRDPWFIRLPDGRVLKAKSTDAVRHHLEAGHIPRNSYARRDASEEWVALTWIQEFSGERPVQTRADSAELPPQLTASNPDAGPRSGVSSRLDPMRLQTVGVRGFVDELLAALDSTLNRSKLITACLMGVLIGVIMYLVPWAVLQVWAEGLWLGWLVAAVVAALILAYGVTQITRQTHLELSRMRPVEAAEARAGMQPFFGRLFIAYLIMAGLAVGLVLLFQRVPDWIAGAGLDGAALTALQTGIWVVGVLFLVMVFGVLLNLVWLLAPVLIVEEGSVGDALREARALFREHRLRILLYEAMALGMGIVATLPIAIPIFLALTYSPPFVGDPRIIGVVVFGLMGLAAGPLLACMAVANVFAYLNLRYEYTPAK